MKDRLERLIRTVYKRYLKTLGYSQYLSRYLFRIIQIGIYIGASLLTLNIFALIFGGTTTLGAFGDFLGGTLNPIFTFLMLIGLVATIVLQKIELSLARKEFGRSADALKAQDLNLEYQRFENTFFKLLEFLEVCRNDITHSGIQQPTTIGRDAIERMYEVFIRSYLHDNSYNPSSGESTNTFKDTCITEDGIKEQYLDFYNRDYGNELAQYFRTLYNVLKLVDQSPKIKDKYIYTNILRAQLSRYELLLLFYNCVSSYGEEKMKPLVKKYRLLKHLEKDKLPKENLAIWKGFNA